MGVILSLFWVALSQCGLSLSVSRHCLSHSGGHSLSLSLGSVCLSVSHTPLSLSAHLCLCIFLSGSHSLSLSLSPDVVQRG